MANTIRLKQGTGSDPSASDLVLGEPAVRTDTGEIFLLKDDGSIAKVAGGIEDGDKGDITVSNDGATFTIDNNAVTYAKMGGISTNRLMGRISSGSGSPETLTPANVRTIINVEDGATADQTASEILTLIKTVDGSGSGLDADTVDGLEVSASGGVSKILCSKSDGDVDIGSNSSIYVQQVIATSQTPGVFKRAVTGTSPAAIHIGNDSRTWSISAHSTEFSIRDHTNVNAARLTIDTSGVISGNGSGLTSLNASNISSGSVPAARLDTATTQSAGNNSTKIATTAYTDTAISNLINGAPAALDTLNELAAAMNDDAAFSTTVTNSLATKLPLAGGQITGNITCSGSQTFDGRDLSVDGSKLDGIESGATADQSASEILTLIKTVDGAGSGLDADTLDGINSTTFARIDGTNMGAATFRVDDADFVAQDGTDTVSNFIWRDHSADKLYLGTANAVVTPRSSVIPNADSTYNIGSSSVRWANGYFDTLHGDGSNLTNLPSQTDNNFTNSDHSKLDGIESGATADQSASEILTLLKTVDGSGSGLDADTLDGLGAPSFVRSSADDTMSGILSLTSSSQYPLNINGSDNGKIVLQGASNPYIRWREGSTDKAYIQWSTSGYLQLANEEAGEILRLKDGANGLVWSVGGTEHVVYHANNLTVGDGGLTQKNFTTTLKNKLDGIAASATNVTNNNQLTNGAGYTTYTANQAVNTGSQPTFLDVYTNGWFRNNQSGEGMYNQANGMHWYSGAAGYMDIGGGQSGQGIRCRDNHNGTLRGYFYYDNSNRIGILDGDGNWAVRVDKDVSVDFRVNSTVELTVLPDTVRCEGAFFENAQAVAANKTISDGYNAMSAGPITVNNSVTVTVGSGEVWTII